MLEEVNEILKKINSLQEQISSCKDDKIAINLQQELVELLSETFKNEDLLTAMLLSGKNLPQQK